MKISKFDEYITERLKKDSVDPDTLKVLKQNLLDHLKEYKEYILRNIFIEKKEVFFSDFKSINTRIILRELNNEFTKDFVTDYKIEDLLDYINDQMKEPKLSIKKNIREKFYTYFKLLSK
jgi:hypothetical protein